MWAYHQPRYGLAHINFVCIFAWQIIPRAIDYFTGKALEYDDNMEELDDDEFDEEDFDDDVSRDSLSRLQRRLLIPNPVALAGARRMMSRSFVKLTLAGSRTLRSASSSRLFDRNRRVFSAGRQAGRRLLPSLSKRRCRRADESVRLNGMKGTLPTFDPILSSYCFVPLLEWIGTL